MRSDADGLAVLRIGVENKFRNSCASVDPAWPLSIARPLNLDLFLLPQVAMAVCASGNSAPWPGQLDLSGLMSDQGT